MSPVNLLRSVQHACAKAANEHDGLILRAIQPGDFLSAISRMAALNLVWSVNSQCLGLCIMVKSAPHGHCCCQVACLVHVVRHCCTIETDSSHAHACALIAVISRPTMGIFWPCMLLSRRVKSTTLYLCQDNYYGVFIAMMSRSLQ